MTVALLTKATVDASMAILRTLILILSLLNVASATEVIRLPDGSTYTGPLQDGKLHGHGTLEWTNGNRYEGGFVDGLMDGGGVFSYASGDRYEGGMRAGFSHGLGRLEFAGGGDYQGEFHDGYPHGEGTLRNPDGTLYTGDLEFGMPSGNGTLRYQTGEVYEGAFADGVYHGTGTMKMSGATYAGTLEMGSLVHGTLEDGQGGRYTGGFQDWTFAGEGEYVSDYGTYRGRFEGGDFVEGVHEKSDGSVDEGSFYAWTLHGDGRRTTVDGLVIEGEFDFGEPAATPTSNSLFDGLLDFARNAVDAWFPMPDPDQLVAERSLYAQTGLLEEQLSQIGAQDPDKIDLYALIVGGDGSQEVFRREVEFASDLMKTELPSQVVTLTNSRTSVDRIPMATRTSVREAIDRIGRNMDLDQDILFVYLTSHGSPDHDLILNQNGMDLPDLPAAELAGFLKMHPFAHKVVVVSACYSGGFIPFLKDGNTTIITAAREDRTSFGCTDENDFTDFGRALLRDNLHHVDGLAEAFTRATQRVAESESEQGIERASEPQFHNEGEVTAQFDRWMDTVRR